MIVFIYLSMPLTLLLQEVHWDRKSLLSRRKVMSMRNPVQLNLSIESIFVVRKLSEYLQLNHIACADLFVEVTSIFLCIILRNRYFLPACAWCIILLLFYELLLGITKYLVSSHFLFLSNLFQQVIDLWREIGWLLPDLMLLAWYFLAL